MARYFKQGLDYFPLDVSFDDDLELFEAECGLDGLAILIKLWQKIYSQGYYLEWNEDICLLFSKKINSDINKINSVINVGLRRNLFDKLLHEKYRVLTSSGIQKRYITACASSKRKQILIDRRYFLLDGHYEKLVTDFIEETPEEIKETPEEIQQKKGKEKESKYIGVFNYWNLKDVTVHKSLSPVIESAIAKALKHYNEEEICTAIDRYTEAKKNNAFYYSYKWTLDKFLKQGNGYVDWLDEGQRWVEYQDFKEKPTKQDKGKDEIPWG